MSAPPSTALGALPFSRLEDDETEETLIKHSARAPHAKASKASPAPTAPAPQSTAPSNAQRKKLDATPVTVTRNESVPEQSSPDASLMTMYETLKATDALTAARIARIELTAGERDVLARTVMTMNDLAFWSEKWRARGTQLWATQILCAASVPALIGMIGVFDSSARLVMQFIAIALSITGTACRAMEDAFDWRSQSSVRQRVATRMKLLFDSFCVLSGDLFDPEHLHSGPARGSSRARCCRSAASLSGSVAGYPSVDSPIKQPAPSPQAQLVAALEELRLQHSGANFRKYVVAFTALEQHCSEALATLQDRSQM